MAGLHRGSRTAHKSHSAVDLNRELRTRSRALLRRCEGPGSKGERTDGGRRCSRQAAKIYARVRQIIYNRVFNRLCRCRRSLGAIGATLLDRKPCSLPRGVVQFLLQVVSLAEIKNSDHQRQKKWQHQRELDELCSFVGLQKNPAGVMGGPP